MLLARKFPGLQTAYLLCAIVLAGLSLGVTARAQSADSRAIPALMISDIHLDPFHAPARVPQLVRAPVSQWGAILAPPSSPAEDQAFAELQQSCHARGADTPYVLLRSSLQAMRLQQPNARFITVSGDLIAHSFLCRYKTVFPQSTQAEYEAFVLKTIGFIEGELRASFPGVPVYVSLGNNDTACDDYRLDAGSNFLAEAGRIISEGLPDSESAQAAKEFTAGGYYSVTMAPLSATRLIVLNDLFLSPRYSTCAGKPDPSAAALQMAWLREQLAETRKLGQTAWVMGHIPPGVDPYSTVAKFRDVCADEPAEMFLSNDAMADLLIEYADVVRLGVFAHTHMDEMRLLQKPGSDAGGHAEHAVAVKLIPSISPVNGNKPSFTVARVDSPSGVLLDYAVFTASNKTGAAVTWSKEYDYAETFHEPAFSAKAVKDLDAKFKEDIGGITQPSDAYIRHYFAGDLAPELKPFWPQYVCSLENYTARGFAACVCSPGK